MFIRADRCSECLESSVALRCRCSCALCTVHCALCTVVQLVGIEYHRALWYPRMVSANGISLPVSIRNKFADFTPAFDAARRAQLKIAVSHSAYC